MIDYLIALMAIFELILYKNKTQDNSTINQSNTLEKVENHTICYI